MMPTTKEPTHRRIMEVDSGFCLMKVRIRMGTRSPLAAFGFSPTSRRDVGRKEARGARRMPTSGFNSWESRAVL